MTSLDDFSKPLTIPSTESFDQTNDSDIFKKVSKHVTFKDQIECFVFEDDEEKNEPYDVWKIFNNIFKYQEQNEEQYEDSEYSDEDEIYYSDDDDENRIIEDEI